MIIKDFMLSPMQQMKKKAFVLSRGEDPFAFEVARQLRKRHRMRKSSTSSSHQSPLTCLRVTRDADKVLVILFVC